MITVKVFRFIIGVIYLFSEITRQEMESTIEFLFPGKKFIYSVVYDQTVTSIKESKDDHVHWCKSSDELIDDEMVIEIARSYFLEICPQGVNSES